MMRFLRRAARGFHRDESGTASVEFVLAVPVLMTIFMASFESGLLMTRSIMLEQSLDMTMRELRLGNILNPNNATLKAEICSRTVIFDDCEDRIMIEMLRVDTGTWAMPATATQCVDREEDVQPVTMLQIGQQNDIMLMRVCIVMDPMFPMTGLGLGLPKDSQGGYGLTAMSAFVNEPS